MTDDEISKIAGTYHAWRGDQDCANKYEDQPGFCKSASLDDIRHHNHLLSPGRYVGTAEVEADEESFEEKMERFTADLRAQINQSANLDKNIWANLEDLGYGE